MRYRAAMRGRQRTVGKQSGNAEVNTAMYMPSSLQDHLRDPPAWTKAFLRTFGCGIANHFKKETKNMNTLVIVLIAAVVLFGAYVFYGRWLANKWGIDPKAKTPAVEFNDGKDFVPTNGWTVFSHQFSSIAGAGPVTGAFRLRRSAGCRYCCGC